ncbi:hypothetical protein, partial [Streptomyces sp. NPDC007205]|uniref:hypothetical protein n=1 Tax=Streptomyces sp. NPDC007205 TaxID=3154316 RepID=UPI00340D4326
QSAALRLPHNNGVPRGSSPVSDYDNPSSSSVAASTRLAVAAGRPLPGNRHDARARPSMAWSARDLLAESRHVHDRRVHQVAGEHLAAEIDVPTLSGPDGCLGELVGAKGLALAYPRTQSPDIDAARWALGWLCIGACSSSSLIGMIMLS